MPFSSFSMWNTMGKATLHQANKLLVTTRSKTKAEGATLPSVHGVQKHLDPAIKPKHDKPVTDQNKQKGPTSADAKPRVLLRPKLPASQVAKKRLIDRSIKLLNKPKIPNKCTWENISIASVAKPKTNRPERSQYT